MWEFPKIRGTILVVPIIRTIVYWGLYGGTLILGNYYMFLLDVFFSGPSALLVMWRPPFYRCTPCERPLRL